jgi:arylsulfatase A-like enzyme
MKRNSDTEPIKTGRASDLLAVAIMVLAFLAVPVGAAQSGETQVGKSYNVLFIAIDDINDWVGCLGGNSQAITPNLDRFAREHAMVMNKAYCPSTVCCPTRSALLTGKHATHTGVYGNGQNLKDAPKAKDLETLPEYFGNRGYHTLSAGKIFHKHATLDGLDEGQWAFHEHVHPGGGNKGLAWKEKPEVEGVNAGGTEFSWGACNAPLEATKDYVACKWAADQLQRDFESKPFFLALGISKPHLPWFVPQEFFEMYPLERVEAAPFRRNDLDDIVRDNGRTIFKPGARFQLADRTGMHKQANRAYLACISYVDACLGMLFDTLEKSQYHDNTIVMIWGDHGWHLGEKLQYGKTNLWEDLHVSPSSFACPGLPNPVSSAKGS